MNEWLMPTLTIAAIIVGPITAVGLQLWMEKRRQKRQAKMWLFSAMMAYRKSSPPAAEWVSALNQIDVIFYDAPKVVQAWHSFFDALDRPPEQANHQATLHRMLDLLHEMAKHLGYPEIKQTDLDRFYSPVQYGNVATLQSALQYELLRVLQNTDRVLVELRKDDPSAQRPCSQRLRRARLIEQKTGQRLCPLFFCTGSVTTKKTGRTGPNDFHLPTRFSRKKSGGRQNSAVSYISFIAFVSIAEYT